MPVSGAEPSPRRLRARWNGEPRAGVPDRRRRNAAPAKGIAPHRQPGQESIGLVGRAGSHAGLDARHGTRKPGHQPIAMATECCPCVRGTRRGMHLASIAQGPDVQNELSQSAFQTREEGHQTSVWREASLGAATRCARHSAANPRGRDRRRRPTPGFAAATPSPAGARDAPRRRRAGDPRRGPQRPGRRCTSAGTSGRPRRVARRRPLRTA